MVFFSSCCPKLSSKVFGGVLIIAGKQNVLQQVAVRSISSKAMRHRLQVAPKPAPFPYKEKRYTFLRALLDTTTDRLDENSKLIVVEGPPAAGKSTLAKELAEELDMIYIPAPTMASFYINDYGFDLRKLDHDLPESCQSYDESDFLKDPSSMSGSRAGRLQLMKYQLRYKSYLEALAHILNTGQGVVMDRSPYSDFTYIEAMAKQGIVSKNIQQFYYKVRENSLFALWKPHLVIYLDVPVSEVRRRIEARNRPNEKDSAASSPAYLQSLEDSYKQTFLKDISTHADVLIYDWTEPGDSEIVVEDVERLDFDKYTVYDTKMEDWRRVDDWDWNNSRQNFTNRKDFLMNYTNVPGFSCPEILIPGEDWKIYERVVNSAPGNKFIKGYNADMGDSGLLFKL
nr:EOG090X05NZ [Eurycercus lamellatus]